MAVKKRRRRRSTKKRKGKVKVTQKVGLKQKSDTTKLDTIQGRLPADAGANFKITIRKKKD